MNPQKPWRLIFQRREPSGGRAAGILAVSRQPVRTFLRRFHPSDALKHSGVRRDVRVVRPRPHFGDKRRRRTGKKNPKQTAVIRHHSSLCYCFNEAPLLASSLLLFSSLSKKHLRIIDIENEPPPKKNASTFTQFLPMEMYA